MVGERLRWRRWSEGMVVSKPMGTSGGDDDDDEDDEADDVDDVMFEVAETKLP